MIQKRSRKNDVISVEQLRAARGLLGWSQTDLASRAGLSLPTVKRLEGGFGPKVSDEARLRLREAIEAAGVELIEHVILGQRLDSSKRVCHLGGI